MVSRFVRRLNSAVGLTALSLVAFGLGIVAVEVLTRLFVPQQLIMMVGPEIWRPVEGLGWATRENVDTIVNTGEADVRFVTDSDGHRVSAMANAALSPRIEAKTVLTFGDSFLQALSVDYDSTIPALLETRLNGPSAGGVRVLNTANSGWDPNQYYLAVREELSIHDADLGVIFLFTGNDIVERRFDWFDARQEGRAHEFRVPHGLGLCEWINAVLYPINDTLERRSHLFNLFKVRFQLVLGRMLFRQVYFPEIFLVRKSDWEGWSVTAAICRSIQDEFALHNVPVVFVLIPPIYQVHDDAFEDYVTMLGVDPESVDLLQPNVRMKDSFKREGPGAIGCPGGLEKRGSEGASVR